MTAETYSDIDLYGDEAEVLRRVLLATSGIEPRPAQPIPERLAGALYYRELPDGQCIAVYPLLAGTVRIVIGPTGEPTYEDAWCYASPIGGHLAAACWDGVGDPPQGWFRNISSARRRPEGDPAKEYVAR